MLPTRLPVRRVLVAAAALVGVAFLGACGSDDGGAPDGAPEPLPAISIGSDLSMSTGEDGASPSPEVDEECLALQEVWAETSRAVASIDEEHPRVLVAGFREANRVFGEADAPQDVPGWTVVGDYLSTAAGALEDIDPDDADEVASVMTLAFSEADTTRAVAAMGEVTEYLNGGCEE